jgi:GNAT superfamily N-acetyltransferase
VFMIQQNESQMTAPETRSPALRPATADDVEAIAAVWHGGWADGHLGNVPDALVPHRKLADFRRLVPSRLDLTTVATIGSRVVGFVTVHDDEIEQIYVDRSARGSGVAAALLDHGERTIAARFALGWLAVVAGNARARSFYARQGWYDSGPIDYPAETAAGRIPVPSRRYEKRLESSP